MKICCKCGVPKDESSFRTRGSKREDLQAYCKSCDREYNRAAHRRLKIETLEHYGGVRCVCCGITEPVFLALDHVNNDGAIMRKLHKNGMNFYKWLRVHNWPDLGLQVSCHNCNLGRHINGGVCPHKALLPDGVIGSMTGSEPVDESSNLSWEAKVS